MLAQSGGSKRIIGPLLTRQRVVVTIYLFIGAIQLGVILVSVTKRKVAVAIAFLARVRPPRPPFVAESTSIVIIGRAEAIRISKVSWLTMKVSWLTMKVDWLLFQWIFLVVTVLSEPKPLLPTGLLHILGGNKDGLAGLPL